MDLALPINLSLRDALIALVALLALYVIIAGLRIRRLKRQKALETPLSPMAAQSAVAAYAAAVEPELGAEPAVATSDSIRREPEPLAAPSDAAFPWNEPPGDTALQRQVALLESELAQLRKEVGGLRAEVLILREEQHRMMDIAAEPPEAEVMEEPLEVTSNVSPLYNEAMQFALQGQDAAAISQSCGISRAEAELVVALVRNREI